MEILTREFVVEKVGSGEGRDGRPFNYIRDGLSDDDDVYWAKHHKQIEHLEPGNRVRVQCTASKKHHNYNLIGNAENLDAKATTPAAAYEQDRSYRNQPRTKQVRPSMSPEDARSAFICLGVTNQFHGAGAHGVTSGDIKQAMLDWGNAYDAFHGNVTIVNMPRTVANVNREYSELEDKIPDHL